MSVFGVSARDDPTAADAVVATRRTLAERLTTSFWFYQLGGWSAYVVGLAVPWLGSYPLGAMLRVKLVVAGTGVLVTCMLRGAHRRIASPDATVTASFLLRAFALSLTGALAWTAALNALAPLALGDRARVSSPQLFDGASQRAFVMLTWSLLYVTFRQARARAEERARAVRTEALANRAALDALRYQLHPHFLFNALNAISTLVIERRPEGAAEAIARLGVLLRTTLTLPPSDEISLEQELGLIGQYTGLESLRFGDRLAVDVRVDRSAAGACVPALVLQPLVENAIRHAVARKPGGGRVVIEAERRGTVLRLSVTDDGAGIVRATPGEGTGLRNTRERLRLLYGDAHRFSLGAATGGGTSAVVELPYRCPAPRHQ